MKGRTQAAALSLLLLVASANAGLFSDGGNVKAEEAAVDSAKDKQTQTDKAQQLTPQDDVYTYDEEDEAAAAPQGGQQQQLDADAVLQEQMAYRQAAWEQSQQVAANQRRYLEALLEEEAKQVEAIQQQQKEKQMMALLAEINDGYEQIQKVQQQQQQDEPEDDDEEEEKAEKVPKKHVERSAPSEADMAIHQAIKSEQDEEVPKQGEQLTENVEQQATASAPSMQKKGQSEFVSFVDPDASLRTASKLNVDKRQMDNVRTEKIRQSGGLIFLGVGTVMLVGMLGAAVGGSYYYKRRNDEPDDQEYAPYAGTGPRTKKPIKGEKGDDALAYKAQLHHYQQAKQKIICGDDAVGVGGESEGEEDDVEDENNFSVYECPGLAPTGDIEVHNPNFAAH